MGRRVVLERKFTAGVFFTVLSVSLSNCIVYPINPLPDAESLVDTLSNLPFRSQAQLRNYRLYVGSECDQTSDCTGGECRIDSITNKKTCMCLDGTFRYSITLGLDVCLRCRNLNGLCSFDQECQCSDGNAVCENAAPPRKGRCKCRANYMPWLDTATQTLTCQTGAVQSLCASDRDCKMIKFADSKGNLINTTGSQENGPLRHAQCSTQLSKSLLASNLPESSNVTSRSENSTKKPDVSVLKPIGVVLVSHPVIWFGTTNVTNSTALSWPSDDISEKASEDVATVIPEPRIAPSNMTVLFENSCQCPEGFQVSPNNSYVCQDIDECSEAEDPCNPVVVENAQSICVNNVGSYSCECNDKFALAYGVPPSGICCKLGHVPCLDATKCIPLDSLCNGIPDCDLDCSDELYPFCNFNHNRPFPDFSHHPRCHEEVVDPGFTDQPVNDSTLTTGAITATLTVTTTTSATLLSIQHEELLPLGAGSLEDAIVTPPNPLPTLPSNMTAARLLGYTFL